MERSNSQLGGNGSNQQQGGKSSKDQQQGGKKARHVHRGKRSSESITKRNYQKSIRSWAKPEQICVPLIPYTQRDFLVYPVPAKHITLSRSTKVRDAAGGLLVQYFKKPFPRLMCDTLLVSTEELRLHVKPDRNTTKSFGDVYRFGHWQSGLPTTKPLKKTLDPNVQLWIKTNQSLFEKVATAVGTFFPEVRKRNESLPEEKRLFGMFSFAALYINSQNYPRPIKYGYRGQFGVLIPLGDWTGGGIHFKHLNTTIELVQQDFILFAEDSLIHENTPAIPGKTRHSLVLTTHPAAFYS